MTPFDGIVGGPFEVSHDGPRWQALAADFVGFAADDDATWRRLELEHWLLDRWRAAGVPVARVLRTDAAHRVQIRERLHGITGAPVEPRCFVGTPDAAARYDGAPLTPFGERLAASYGELAARIRGAVSIVDGAALGVTSRRTLDLDAAIARLHDSAASSAAKAAADRARTWLAALPAPDAVIHADLHFHNMCLAADGAITGLWDLGDAGLDAATTELLYVPSLGSRFLAIVLAAYGPVDVDAVNHAHLRTVLDHVLAYGPDTPRHASVIGWASAAFERMA